MILHDSRDGQGPGILIVQHLGYKEKGFSLDLRGGIIMARVFDRDDRTGGLGSWIRPKGESLGDLNLAFLWEKSTRPISGYAFAWPSVLASSGGIVTGTGKCQPGDGPPKPMLPIFDAAGTADVRYKPLSFTGILNQSYPIGTIGITLAASDENDQIPLFFPCDSRLFAPNRGGYANMGTPIYDLRDAGQIDEFARLQSFWRVQNIAGQRILAWQIYKTGCGGDAPGLVYGKPLAGAKGDRLTGIINEHDGGPLSVGLKIDKHFNGFNSNDGEPQNAVHLSTGTLFNASPDAQMDYDGPLEFQKVKYVEPPPQPFTTRVHLRYDPIKEHSFRERKEKGAWRWLAETYWYIPSSGGDSSKCPGIPNQTPVASPIPPSPGSIAGGASIGDVIGPSPQPPILAGPDKEPSSPLSPFNPANQLPTVPQIPTSFWG